MMRLFVFLSVSILLTILLSCGEKLTEQQLRALAIEYENKEMHEEEIEVYEKLVKQFPNSGRLDEDLYKLGVKYANNLKDFKKSVECYTKLVENFPESDYRPQSKFMIGYRYANDIKDLEKAKKNYEEFLEMYPDHELASSVKWELEHLGKDISEIDLELGSGDSLVTQ